MKRLLILAAIFGTFPLFGTTMEKAQKIDKMYEVITEVDSRNDLAHAKYKITLIPTDYLELMYNYELGAVIPIEGVDNYASSNSVKRFDEILSVCTKDMAIKPIELFLRGLSTIHEKHNTTCDKAAHVLALSYTFPEGYPIEREILVSEDSSFVAFKSEGDEGISLMVITDGSNIHLIETFVDLPKSALINGGDN